MGRHRWVKRRTSLRLGPHSPHIWNVKEQKSKVVSHTNLSRELSLASYFLWILNTMTTLSLTNSDWWFSPSVTYSAWFLTPNMTCSGQLHALGLIFNSWLHDPLSWLLLHTLPLLLLDSWLLMVTLSPYEEGEWGEFLLGEENKGLNLIWCSWHKDLTWEA